MSLTRLPARRSDFYESFRRYLADPSSGAAAHAAEFETKVRSSDMRYAGEPLDVAYFPLAVAPEDEARLAREVEATLSLLERATRAFLEDPVLQAELDWSPERLALVAHDPGYGLAIPCARFDSYWDGAAGLKFLEVNTDGTSGMTNVERVSRFFLESPAIAPQGLATFNLRASVLETLLSCYRDWRARAPRHPPEEPRIAIVDWRTVKTSAEFRALKRSFEERGLRAAILDPRDLRYDGGALLDAQGEPVDLIYRRVVSTEVFAASPEDVRAMTAAFRADAVCVVGSFRSDIAFDKRFMAILTTPELAARCLDARDRALALRLFPETLTLRPGAVLERALLERERLVLKPAALYEGRGVRVGVETPAGEWRAALEAAAPAGGHVVQERVQAPELTVELVEGGRFRARPLYLSLGEYAFGGRLSGLNARVASTLVLSADDDERLLPVVRLA